ncbi:hypothetical protein GCM10027169_26920 [Gordonia jinhuaensis]|uniref:Uncharacterized protein n=2 Tax=Gordonia jinhuaensis TaxID=1517702 RepID=A0A916TCR7_9ACTN|nr:hypothetical protein GCM10011489_26790 [Gordonia jinhuaensis]
MRKAPCIGTEWPTAGRLVVTQFTGRRHRGTRDVGTNAAEAVISTGGATVVVMRIRHRNWLLILAGVVFVIGLVATALMFLIPAVDGGHSAPTLVYGLSMLTPIGFLLGLIFALTAGRRHPATVDAQVSTDRAASSVTDRETSADR